MVSLLFSSVSQDGNQSDPFLRSFHNQGKRFTSEFPVNILLDRINYVNSIKHSKQIFMFGILTTDCHQSKPFMRSFHNQGKRFTSEFPFNTSLNRRNYLSSTTAW